MEKIIEEGNRRCKMGKNVMNFDISFLIKNGNPYFYIWYKYYVSKRIIKK